MESLTKKIHKSSYSTLVKEYEIFHWEVTNKVIEGDYIIVDFVRDDDIKQIDKIKLLEAEYFKNIKPLPFFPVVVFIAVAFTILTAFLIVFLITKNKDIFPFFIIPSTLFIIMATTYSIIRINKYKTSSLESKSLKEDIISKIKEIDSCDR